MTTESKPKKRKGLRILFAGLALSALGLGTWYFVSRNKKQNKPLTDGSSPGNDPGDTPDYRPRGINPGAPPSYQQPASDFPLKKGSRGDKVRQLQKLLIEKFGSTILPKYGADGVFGNELIVALQARGISIPVTEEAFATLTKTDPKTLAEDLKKQITARDYQKTLNALKKIRNVTEYQDVGKEFRALRMNGVETSLPTALLRNFKTSNQQTEIDTVLTAQIGLNKSGDKYSIPTTVSGLGKLREGRVITTRTTRVWARARHPLSVGKDTILGRAVSSSNGITEFETVDGYRLFVITDHIRYFS